jgi:hypothetical protein
MVLRQTHSTVCVMLRVPSHLANNPQQSEEASHMGGKANCKSHGLHEVMESDEGYYKLYTVSEK